MAATLTVLTVINLLNSLDRYLLSAILPSIRSEFAIADSRAGLPGSMFMLTYLLASPLSGFLGDRLPRTHRRRRCVPLESGHGGQRSR